MEEETPKMDARSALLLGVKEYKPKSNEICVDFPGGNKAYFTIGLTRKQLAQLESASKKEVDVLKKKHPNPRIRQYCEDDTAGAIQCAELSRYFNRMEDQNGQILPGIVGFDDFVELAIEAPSFFNTIQQQVLVAQFGFDLGSEVNDLVGFTEETPAT